MESEPLSACGGSSFITIIGFGITGGGGNCGTNVGDGTGENCGDGDALDGGTIGGGTISGGTIVVERLVVDQSPHWLDVTWLPLQCAPTFGDVLPLSARPIVLDQWPLSASQLPLSARSSSFVLSSNA